MYTPAHFREERLPEIWGIMREHSFATLVTNGALGLIASHVPLELLEEPAPYGRLQGHVARANPQWRDLDSGCETLVIFQGPHAYVSPSWYPSKAEDGKVVPTWNYIAVHAYCKPRSIHTPDELLPLLRRLTAKYEAGRLQPWAVEDAPADFIESMARGVVGFELTIERLEAKRKLSQNRSAADRRGARDALNERSEQERAVAAQMPE